MKNYDDPMEMREDFSALLDDELSPEEREVLEARLGESADTLRELENFKKVDELYKQLPPHAAPEGFERRLRQALDPSPLKPWSWRMVGRRWQPVLGLAAAVLLTVSLAIAVQQFKSDPIRIAGVADKTESESPALLRQQAAGRLNDEFRAADAEAGPATPAESVTTEIAADALEFEKTRSARKTSVRGEASRDLPGSAAAAAPRADASETDAPEAEQEAFFADEAKKEDERLAKSAVTEQVQPRDAAGPPAGAAEPARAFFSTAAPVFNVVNDTLIEDGYTDQEVTELARGSELLRTTAEQHPALLEYVKDERARIFKLGAVWYRIPPAETPENER